MLNIISNYSKKYLKKELRSIENAFDKLWPINRSITGNGTRETHKILRKIIPLKTYEVKSEKVFNDWKIPLEWNVKEAFILDPKGRKIIDFKNNNLHLMGYSTPFKGYLSLEDLKKYLNYVKNQPDAIPYRTSYYKRQWGFCLSYNQFKNLKKGKYYVCIDSTLSKGSLTLSDHYIKGKIDKEIIIHAYTCHPSMANNELTGPLIAAFLAKRIKNNFLSYRFVFVPETIGAIAYLKIKEKKLNKDLLGGIVCTCLGIKNKLGYKKSKINQSPFDLNVIKTIKKEFKNIKLDVLEFNPSGSDERQYCSLGYNFPVGCLFSLSYGKYKEYHTSKDNKEIISFLYMQKIINLIFKILANFEKEYFEKANTQIFKNKKKLTKINKKFPLCIINKGEPMFSKYKIHYGLKNQKMADKKTLAIKWLVHYSDGTRSLKEISKMSKIESRILLGSYKELKKHKILR